MLKQLFFAICVVLAISAHSQNLVFNIDQLGVATKKTHATAFSEAEVINSSATIYINNHEAVVVNEQSNRYKLLKNRVRKTAANITETWTAFDDHNLPVQFSYTIHPGSKTVVVEIDNKKQKQFYFGYCPLMAAR